MTTTQMCTWQTITGSATIAETVEKKLSGSASPVELRAIAAAYEAACDYALSRQCPVLESEAFVRLVGDVVYNDPDDYETTVGDVKSVIEGVLLDKIIRCVLAVTRPTVCDCLKEQPAD
jgi:hypothetical protein